MLKFFRLPSFLSSKKKRAGDATAARRIVSTSVSEDMDSPGDSPRGSGSDGFASDYEPDTTFDSDFVPSPVSKYTATSIFIAMVARTCGYGLLGYLYSADSTDPVDASIKKALELGSDQYVVINNILRIGIHTLFVLIGGILASTKLKDSPLLIVAVGTGLQALALFGIACVVSVKELYVAVGLMAAGAGLMFAPCFPLFFELLRVQKVTATGILMVAHNLGDGIASSAELVAQTQLGWRGVYRISAAAAALGSLLVFISMAMESAEEGAAKRTPRNHGAMLGGSDGSQLLAVIGQVFGSWFGAMAILGAIGVQCVDYVQASWNSVYFEDYAFTEYSDLYYWLNFAVVQVFLSCLGIMTGAWVADFWLEKGANTAAYFYVPAIAALISGTFWIIVPSTVNFYLAMSAYAVAYFALSTISSPLFAAVQCTVPHTQRAGTLGIFVAVMQVVASAVVTYLTTLSALTDRQKLLLNVPLSYFSAVMFFVAAPLYLGVTSRVHELLLTPTSATRPPNEWTPLVV